MVILVRRWAEMHMAAHPEVQIQVTGGGSGTGLAALQNGTTDIAASSRPIERAEIANFIVAHAAKPREVAVAMDGIAVYVHRDNTVPGLNFAQLTGIFAGETRDWSELGQPAGPIVAYTRENSSGTYAFFKEHVMGKRDFGTTAQAMAGTAALIHAVAKDVRGIGYGGIGYHSGEHLLRRRADRACIGGVRERGGRAQATLEDRRGWFPLHPRGRGGAGDDRQAGDGGTLGRGARHRRGESGRGRLRI
jgi:phosphate transport system substrate-binding protein